MIRFGWVLSLSVLFRLPSRETFALSRNVCPLAKRLPSRIYGKVVKVSMASIFIKVKSITLAGPSGRSQIYRLLLSCTSGKLGGPGCSFRTNFHGTENQKGAWDHPVGNKQWLRCALLCDKNLACRDQDGEKQSAWSGSIGQSQPLSGSVGQLQELSGSVGAAVGFELDSNDRKR